VSHLDLTDPAAVAAWLADLRLAFADADAVTRDTLRRPRRRELGPVLARHNYRDAHQRITSLLALADPTSPAPPAAPAPPAVAADHDHDLPRRRPGDPRLVS
jgi:hypothetical protein